MELHPAGDQFDLWLIMQSLLVVLSCANSMSLY